MSICIDINLISESICRLLPESKPSLLDNNNIVWKVMDGDWIGKRSVWTFDLRACWLEDTDINNIKSWWCGGIDADYGEIFKK